MGAKSPLFFMDLDCASMPWFATGRMVRLAPAGLLPDRFAAPLLLEQIGDHIAAGGQAHPVALDLRHEPARDIMVLVLMADAAIGADQLDPVAFDPVDRPEMHSVRADHFHMLANVFEAAHRLLPRGTALASTLLVQGRSGLRVVPLRVRA